MSGTLSLNPRRQLEVYAQSTPGFPIADMLQRRLGPASLHLQPVEFLAANPPGHDALIVCQLHGHGVTPAARKLGVRLPHLQPSAYRIQWVSHAAGKALLVIGGDLFGMLAGLADVLDRSLWTSQGLAYQDEERTETPAFPLRYYWTWDHSTNWMLDDPGNQVEGCNNRYFKRPETYLEDYRRLVDHCLAMRFNGIVIWGFLRDAHGGERYACEVARYAADRGVAIMPGVGTTGYGGIYYQGQHPANLETFLATHPQLGNKNPQGELSPRESSPYHKPMQEWITQSLTWLYRNFPIGGINLENNDYMVDCSNAGKRGRAKIKSGEADHFKDQYFAYKSALDVAQEWAPRAWNTYATYSGFNHGQDVTNAGASMGKEPYFARHMPQTAIAQWTISGMLSPQPVPLRQWMDSAQPAEVYRNERWPQGLRPPTLRSAGFIHQASQWSSIRRNSPAISTLAEACLRSHEAGMEGISVHGEVTSRTLAWRLNYLVMRHWTYHPQSTLAQFAQAELAPLLGGAGQGHDLAEALCLLDEGKLDDAYRIANDHRQQCHPYPYPDRGNLEHSRVWREVGEWITLKARPPWAGGFTDMI